MQMYKNGSEFYGGDGIVTKGVENTIRNVCLLAREGMKETDREIISIMIKNMPNTPEQELLLNGTGKDTLPE